MLRADSPCRPWTLLFVLLVVTGTMFAQAKKPITFEQVFKRAEPRITTSLPDITGWADDDHYLLVRKDNGEEAAKVYAVDARTGEESVYRDLSRFKDSLPAGVDPLSPDSHTQSYNHLVYMHEGDLYFLDTERRECKRLTTTAAEEKNPTLSPDGTTVAFTRDHDLYAIDVRSGKELRYTEDGSDVVYNGWAAWLYYEEILGRPTRYRAFWWSPDSRHLAFFRFDESKVPVFPLFRTDGVHGSIENTRYPKPGDPNPEVRIGIVPVEGGPVVWGAFNEHSDQYFGPPFWTPDGSQLFVQWMNRGQDTLTIFAVNPRSGARREIYTEHQPTWVDWFESIYFLKNGKGFVLKSDKDGWAHLYLHAMDGLLMSRITRGRWNVDHLLLVDDKAMVAYFTAGKESSTRKDLYRVDLAGEELTRMTFGDYTHEILLSPQGSYVITTFSNVASPPKMSLLEANGRVVRELGDSKSGVFDEYALGVTEMLTIHTADGYDLPAIWTLPTDFDPSKRYPVLISEYGGPGSPSVSDGWKPISRQWLAHEGMIQFSVDHRGSGHFGKEGVALMHRNLGTWEMHDYIEAVKWLRAKCFVDSTKICITGSSYGGYVTCMALTAGAGYFTYGIASSSPTDWRLYDSHYTERYMDSPDENPEGYKNSSVMTYADRYTGLLRIEHGTMDDNVHMQNSMQLVDKLENLKKHFEFILYPNGRHGWGGPKATHSRNENYRFYYVNLLGKPFPADLFETGDTQPARNRRDSRIPAGH